MAGAWPVQAQGAAGEEQALLPPAAELVNLLEFDDAARVKLGPATYAPIGGSDREPFDRMTLWPRVFIDSAPLNLTTELFGEQMFAPILVGPIGQQRQFHPEGEHATVQGASAAKTVVVISSNSSYPIEDISARAKTTIWYQVYLERDTSAVRAQIERAVKAGCRAICLTVGSQPPRPSQPASVPRPNWRAIEQLRQGLGVPVLLKGVMTPEDAKRAIERDIKGLVVSDGGLSGVRPAPMDVLPSVVDAVGSQVPVLVDGSFRRGTDVIKALALGARAVMLARPPMWGLAAYGADGVQLVLKMLQTELARTMINVGRPTMASIDRSLVKIHGRASS
jgi:isopentenyl diphosphate isomerase/L-lactate dehydrogenase-like FMN-dependent dehydrogenase